MLPAPSFSRWMQKVVFFSGLILMWSLNQKKMKLQLNIPGNTVYTLRKQLETSWIIHLTKPTETTRLYLLCLLLKIKLTAAVGWAAPPGLGIWASPPPLGGAVSEAGPPGCAWHPASWGSVQTPSVSAGRAPSPGSPAGKQSHSLKLELVSIHTIAWVHVPKYSNCICEFVR